ncbi:hypothetical protein D9M69_652710 [compost metagenome]
MLATESDHRVGVPLPHQPFQSLCKGEQTQALEGMLLSEDVRFVEHLKRGCDIAINH